MRSSDSKPWESQGPEIKGKFEALASKWGLSPGELLDAIRTDNRQAVNRGAPNGRDPLAGGPCLGSDLVLDGAPSK
jgi:hypothetical protein